MEKKLAATAKYTQELAEKGPKSQGPAVADSVCVPLPRSDVCGVGNPLALDIYAALVVRGPHAF